MKRRDFIIGSALLGLAAAAGLPAWGAAPASFVQQNFAAPDGESLAYWLYTPEAPCPGMPLVVYLHGGSGKGSDLSLLLEADSLPRFLQQGQLAPAAYVVMPQLPRDCTGWTDRQTALLALVDHLVSQHQLDNRRVSLTGHSMGGTGTWAVALDHPQRFSAIAPLSGSVRMTREALQSLTSLPVWAVVGAKDTIVPPEASMRFVDALARVNGDCRCTVLPEADHFAVPAVYLDQNTGLLDWLTAQTR